MNRKSAVLKYKRGDYVFESVLFVVMTLFGIVTIYPFLNVLALSFNEAYDTIKGGIYIIPRKFTIANYQEIFVTPDLVTAFINSVIRTVVGTFVGVVASTMLAYTLSRKDFIARKAFSIMLIITMYVSGGLIPGYLLIRNLGMFNTFWVYIIPSILGAWNVFIIRSYIDGIPDSLQESARIDGANDIVIFIRIVLPLCLPVLATIALFIAVGHWNSWFDNYLYNNKKELTTLQFELQKILTYATIQVKGTDDARSIEEMAKQVRVTPESLKMAMTMVATVPILLVYPFLQKYFVKGLILGAVKS